MKKEKHIWESKAYLPYNSNVMNTWLDIYNDSTKKDSKKIDNSLTNTQKAYITMLKKRIEAYVSKYGKDTFILVDDITAVHHSVIVEQISQMLETGKNTNHEDTKTVINKSLANNYMEVAGKEQMIVIR